MPYGGFEASQNLSPISPTNTKALPLDTQGSILYFLSCLNIASHNVKSLSPLSSTGKNLLSSATSSYEVEIGQIPQISSSLPNSIFPAHKWYPGSDLLNSLIFLRSVSVPTNISPLSFFKIFATVTGIPLLDAWFVSYGPLNFRQNSWLQHHLVFFRFLKGTKPSTLPWLDKNLIFPNFSPVKSSSSPKRSITWSFGIEIPEIALPPIDCNNWELSKQLYNFLKACIFGCWNPDNLADSPGNPDNLADSPVNPDNLADSPGNPDNLADSPGNPDNLADSPVNPDNLADSPGNPDNLADSPGNLAP